MPIFGGAVMMSFSVPEMSIQEDKILGIQIQRCTMSNLNEIN